MAFTQRIVSLVPSLTEAVAVSAPGRLIAATDWCTHPVDLDVTRVGGTKNPDVSAIVALQPDLVIANAEENREPDLAALRAAGLQVHVTDIRTVAGALQSLRELMDLIDADDTGWLDRADAAWANPPQVTAPSGARLHAVIPIWRRPWMHLGSDTYAGDVLARLGVTNVLAHNPERYPKIALDELPTHDLVVLPDEPYVFTADDGPEAFPGTPAALVSGRLLTWYGPAMVDAPAQLVASIAAAL
jgi:ABC-type Fe3+-hydroxamate transport system substrate-binding protein